MKIKILIAIGLVFMLSSCGSGKKYTSTKRVVLKYPKYKTKHPKVTQNKTIKRKPVKVTVRNTEDYITQFAPIAIREMELYKIPASITLAQGILESGSGRSYLATRSNNHFGIKCHNDWEGKSVTHDDDQIGECFRKYVHPETSYEDHSKFLTTRKRYQKLFKLRPTDYKGWAYGLKRAGYATDSRYPRKLISIIKRYNLHQYDYAKSPKIITPTTPKKEVSTSENSYIVVQGDTLYSIAKRHNTSVERVKQLNNLTNNDLKIGQELILN